MRRWKSRREKHGAEWDEHMLEDAESLMAAAVGRWDETERHMAFTTAANSNSDGQRQRQRQQHQASKQEGRGDLVEVEPKKLAPALLCCPMEERAGVPCIGYHRTWAGATEYRMLLPLN